jgi:transcription-repair coupling factor (superfamily II helicase)
MALYKRISQVRREADLQALAAEVRDRYGPPPAEVEGLLRYAAVRLRAEALGISQVDRSAGALHLRFWPSAAPAPERLVRLVRSLPGAAFSPAGILRVPVPSPAPPLGGLESLLDRLQPELAPSAEGLRA